MTMRAPAWLLCLAAATAATDEAPGGRETLVLVGTISRLDLLEGGVWLRIDGGAVERQVHVDSEKTRLTRGGRLVRPEDIEPGERATVVCVTDAAQPPRALLLKLGPARYALR